MVLAHTFRQTMDPIYPNFTLDRVVTIGQFAFSPSWPLRSSDLFVHSYFLWRTLISKAYRNKPHNLQGLW
ncbi:hypothetical protein TNCV_385481 [Trichonephila clavipes]|nr:hypothetical protein TNCV_385481 [Trichonephila clavipes]